METEVVIAGAVRTPIGRFGGGLASLTAVELGERAAVGAMQRSGITADQIDQSIFGHARQAGCGPNPGRQVAVRAGLPVERPAFTVNQACLSGMQAIMGAARCIRLGEAEVVLAGGMESMSRVPYLLEGRWGFRMGHKPLEDAMYRDGFTDPLCGQVMGETAETLARRYEISREAQDDYAARSQQRCEAARREKRFRDEIIDIEVPGKKGPSTFVDDEHPRDGVNSRSLARLAPVFDRNGTVTAGNSSGITDGASAVIVLSGAAAERLGVRPMARLVGYRVDGVDPSIMGIGPVPAVRNLLPQTGTALEQVDLIELNEAFAAQVLAVDHELKLPHERLNVNGGAIALGHPIGCSGNRIVVTLLHEMLRRNARTGLATLCVSGGMGGAMLFERPGEWA
jgi:acetyl-CoA C-acetyltransferase